MSKILYNMDDFYSVPKLSQPRRMPFSQEPRKKLQSAPFSQRSRQEPLSPQDLQDLPKPRMLEVLVEYLPEWLYLALKHFGGYICFIFVLIMFVFVVGAIVFR